MRAAGVDPVAALVASCRNPDDPDAREFASDVVARLVAAMETLESAEKGAEKGAGAFAPRETRDAAKDDDEEEEEDEDVFATAPPSPAGSVGSAGAGFASGRAVGDAAAAALTAALSGMTVTVEEGVVGCGEGCGEDGAACDPVACLAKRFADTGGPFKLAKQLSTASTAASAAPAAVPEEEKAVNEEDDQEEEEEGYESEMEEDESVAATEEDEDEDEEDAASSEVESVAETMSVAGTEATDEVDDAEAEAAGLEASLAEGSPMESPGPEVVDVAELPGNSPVENSEPPPAAAADVSDEEMGPVSARKRGGGRRARVVLSEDDSEDDAAAAESCGESPEPVVAPGTPPSEPADVTPPPAPAVSLAPPTTGKKKSMLRIKSARKPERRPEHAELDADVSSVDVAATAAPAPTSAAYPKSALKKPRATRSLAADDDDASGDDRASSRPSRRPTRRAAAKAAVTSARKKAIAWLDDEAGASGDDSDDEAEDEDEDAAGSDDDDFVVDDDEVEYDSDASSTAVAEDTRARMTPVMPARTPSPEVGARKPPKSTLKGKTPGGGKTPGRGVTFDPVVVSDGDASDSAGSSPDVIVTTPPAADPYGLDELKTPTPPPPMHALPKTPKSAIGRKPGGGGYGGYDEAPPTHSKALAAALASAAKPGKSLNFARHKETIAKELYREFNRDGFDGRLPEKFEITWNAKLLTTAGLTHYKKVTRSSGACEYHARIELSTKVLDTAEKLEATLLHEMCHAAAWLLDHCAKPPHGAVFKKWANRVMRVYPVVSVDTCHSYQIHQPYKYRCTQSWCQQEYGRHSKSIDVEAKACGVCNGKLEFLGKFNPDGTKAEEKPPTAFSLFVKEHFGAVKDRLPAGTPHKLVMKELSVQWKSAGGTGKKTRGGDSESREEDSLAGGLRSLKL